MFNRRAFISGVLAAPLVGCQSASSSRVVDAWGDSHLAADGLGYGIGHMLGEADRLDNRFSITMNRALVGSIVRDWVGAFREQTTSPLVVVSSGTNEAIRIYEDPNSDCLNYWDCLVRVAMSRKARLIWVAPHQQGILSAIKSTSVVLSKLAGLDPAVVSIVVPQVDGSHIANDGLHYNDAGKQIVLDALVRAVTFGQQPQTIK